MERFSLSKYLKNPSRKVITREGRKVRIICTDAKSDFPIIALVESINDNVELTLSFSKDGLHSVGENIISNYELFFAPEKHEGWINLYKSGNGWSLGTSIWQTEEEAKKWVGAADYTATIKIEWEE